MVVNIIATVSSGRPIVFSNEFKHGCCLLGLNWTVCKHWCGFVLEIVASKLNQTCFGPRSSSGSVLLVRSLVAMKRGSSIVEEDVQNGEVVVTKPMKFKVSAPLMQWAFQHETHVEGTYRSRNSGFYNNHTVTVLLSNRSYTGSPGVV